MITEGLKGRNVLRLQDFSKLEIETMLELGLQLKGDNTMRRLHDDILPRRTLFMMFFNPSLRTRNSFPIKQSFYSFLINQRGQEIHSKQG